MCVCLCIIMVSSFKSGWAAVWILFKVDRALAPKNREHGERPHAAAYMCVCGWCFTLQHVNWNPDIVG